MVLVVAMYFLPSPNINQALGDCTKLQMAHPDRYFIVTSDFSQANLKSILPKSYQHVNFAMRGENSLEEVYTNMCEVYKATKLPDISTSNHVIVMIFCKYISLLKCTKLARESISVWPSGAAQAPQDCFNCTEWDMFREAATYGRSINLEDTNSVTYYISKYAENVNVPSIFHHESQ